MQGPAHDERPIATMNGFVGLFIALALMAAGGLLLSQAISFQGLRWGLFVAAILLLIAGILVLAGLYTLQPNEAAILQLFGAYRGTSRVPGLRATNPFYTRKKLSLRARNLNGERLKVNDKRGNPVEIAAVVVWHVDDTAKAAFDVDDYENVRQGAERGRGPPPRVDVRLRLRGRPGREGADAARGGRRRGQALVHELQARLEQAGVVVEEARLTHLAYAPEIAQVMLRRQQAEAIIAARAEDRPRRGVDGRDGAARAVGQEGGRTSTTSARRRWCPT